MIIPSDEQLHEAIWSNNVVWGIIVKVEP
jgi:hypothetical protein